MVTKVRRVAVIGTGTSGAITSDAPVKEQAFDTIRVFDRRLGVGGTWYHTPQLPTGIISLEDVLLGKADEPVPIPEQLPGVTPFTRQINGHQERFSDSAIHENLRSNITPEIMSFTDRPFPKKLSDYAISQYGNKNVPFRHHSVIQEWIEGLFAPYEKLLELEFAGRNYWWQEAFDAIVVASGHYNVPWFPNIPGLPAYHKKFPDRIKHSKHFRSAKEYVGKKLVVVGASVSSHEIIHEVLDVAQQPVCASIHGDPIPAFGWEPFQHPHIEVKKQIQRFEPETERVVFEDGSYLEDVDHVIFGTGYTFSVPFLPQVQERVKKAHHRLPGVYQHTWNIEDPSLAFIGQLEWERRRVAEKIGGKDYYSIAPKDEEFFEFLQGIAGEPATSTTGRSLPRFDPKWLKVWVGMADTKIGGWKRKRERATDVKGAVKAKL